MFRKIATTLAAGALAVSGLVAISAPAQAASTEIQCPGNISSGYDNAKKRGSIEDEYWLDNVAVVVYKVDNRYEVFQTTGFTTARICFSTKPDRPKNARDSKPPKTAGGGSGGSGAAHAPGYGGPGFNPYPFPPGNKGKVTVGPVESVS